MTTNQELARIFREMASALELLGANPFRAVSNNRIARLFDDLGTDVRALAEEAEDRVAALAELPGVGQGSAEKIVEYLDSGRLAEHDELMAQVPRGLFDVLEIPGVGPKAARAMWQTLGIASLDDLKAKIDSPELAALPRMGAKSIQNLKKALAFTEKGQERVPLGLAHPLADEIRSALAAVPGVLRVDAAGSLRRGRETVGDLDFLVACDDAEAVRERFCTLKPVIQVLARGETKCSVRLAQDEVSIQADLRIVPEAAYGAALLYFTGSKDHNVRLREEAVRRSMRLNEYGLFLGTEERPQDHGATPVAAATEEEIYAALGHSFVPPELREDRGELQGGVPARLIEAADVRAELHAHTVASDGKHTIEELARIAKARGFHTLAITDHSPSQVLANGLDPDRLRRHVDAIREADAKISGITLLAGSEVDILIDGRLDYDDETLALLDVVVASPHASLRQDRETATARLLAAIRHPLVHVLGHPTGRLLGGRGGLEPDMEAIYAAAAEHDVALELNAHWQRLDLRDAHVRGALAHGCKIALDCDVHREGNFDMLRYGILTARRAAMTPESCVNAWPAKRLHAWLRSKR